MLDIANRASIISGVGQAMNSPFGKYSLDKNCKFSHNGKYRGNMRIIARSTLKSFWEKKEYRDSEQPLKAWFDEAKHANWKKPDNIKKQYGNASFLANNRVVFNIHGNKYRLIVAFKYEFGIGYIRFIGTHKQYDKIDAERV